MTLIAGSGRVFAVVGVAAMARACGSNTDVRDTAPCGRAVQPLAEADPDATEDELAASPTVMTPTGGNDSKH
jgi:hypothetical protein